MLKYTLSSSSTDSDNSAETLPQLQSYDDVIGELAARQVAVPASKPSFVNVPDSKFKRFHRDARTQIGLVSMMLFTSIGMWNALNALGALGTGDTKVAQWVNVVNYMTTAVTGILVGGVFNVFGMVSAGLVGTIGCTATIFFLYAYAYKGWVSIWVPILWTGLNSLNFANVASIAPFCSGGYSTTEQRGSFISLCNVLLNLGGLLGGALALILNWKTHKGSSPRLSETTYIAVICITASSFALVCLLCPTDKVIRKDRIKVVVPKRSPIAEFKALPQSFTNRLVLLSLPGMVVNVWQEVFIFNYFNASLSNVRSRGLNSVIYFLGRMLGSVVYQLICDSGNPQMYFRLRRVIYWTSALLIIANIPTVAIFAGAFHIKERSDLDLTDPRISIMTILFLFWGILESVLTSLNFWLVGSLPLKDNNVRNRVVGQLRSFQSVGGLLSWLCDVDHFIPYIAQWGICLALYAVTGVCIALLAEEVRFVEMTDDGKTDDDKTARPEKNPV